MARKSNTNTTSNTETVTPEVQVQVSPEATPEAPAVTETETKPARKRQKKDHDGRKLSPVDFVKVYMAECRENEHATFESLSERISKEMGLNVPADVLSSRRASYEQAEKKNPGQGVILPKLPGIGEARRGRKSTVDWAGLQSLVSA